MLVKQKTRFQNSFFPFFTDGRNRRNKPCRSCNINLGEQVDIEDKFEAEDRNYLLTGNPEVHPMKIGEEFEEKFKLRIAINTAQFGRTFQDRFVNEICIRFRITRKLCSYFFPNQEEKACGILPSLQ